EQKLRWMNGRYLRELDAGDLQTRLEALVGRDLRRDVVEIAQEKISTLDEFWPIASFFFDGPADDPAAREKILGVDGARHGLAAARKALAASEDWTIGGVESTLRGVLEGEALKPKQVFQPIRVALAGGTVSPGIFETVSVLGRDEVLKRIDGALDE
ncbi:MAG: glutamyl-tRNA synthetase, partial [Solirubrobacteraceae bacterium]|nr:glutamyl-tRNA synthetase [Solirubrobacteraceae bacterium]